LFSTHKGKNMRILVAEDDDLMQSALRLGLRKAGFEVDSVTSGIDASIALRTISYDLLILDLGLPDQDGMTVLKTLHQQGQVLPTILITARDSVDDKILGCHLGANYYIKKPFDMRALNARIRAALSQSVLASNREIIHGPIKILPKTREVFIKDTRCNLTSGEFIVLEILLQKVASLVAKNALIEQLMNCNEEYSEKALEAVIQRINKSLDPCGVRIRTVEGFGYMLF